MSRVESSNSKKIIRHRYRVFVKMNEIDPSATAAAWRERINYDGNTELSVKAWNLYRKAEAQLDKEAAEKENKVAYARKKAIGE